MSRSWFGILAAISLIGVTVVSLKTSTGAPPSGSTSPQSAASSPPTTQPVDATINSLRAAISNLDAPAVEQIYAAMKSSKPDDPQLAEAGCLVADFCADKRGSAIDATRIWREVAERFPQTESAAYARIRVAELGVKLDFARSVDEFRAVLREFPNLSTANRERAQLQEALALWQIGTIRPEREPEALAAFNALADSKSISDPGLQARVGLYRKALAEPESPARLIAWYERALRWRKTGFANDLSWRDLHKFRGLARKGVLERYTADESVPAADRAEMWYRAAFAAFETNGHEEAAALAQKALDLKPTGDVRHKSLFLQAYHHAHCGHFEHAASLYRQLLDENPSDDVAVKVYRELAYVLERQPEELESALACDEYMLRFPFRKAEMSDISARYRRIVLRKPQFEGELNTARTKLQAKLGDRRKRPPARAGDLALQPVAAPDLSSKVEVAAQPVGGGE